MTTNETRPTSTIQQVRCDVCHQQIAGTSQTAHVRQSHPEIFAQALQRILEASHGR